MELSIFNKHKPKQEELESLTEIFSENGYPGTKKLEEILGEENAHIAMQHFAREKPNKAFEVAENEVNKEMYKYILATEKGSYIKLRYLSAKALGDEKSFNEIGNYIVNNCPQIVFWKGDEKLYELELMERAAKNYVKKDANSAIDALNNNESHMNEILAREVIEHYLSNSEKLENRGPYLLKQIFEKLTGKEKPKWFTSKDNDLLCKIAGIFENVGSSCAIDIRHYIGDRNEIEKTLKKIKDNCPVEVYKYAQKHNYTQIISQVRPKLASYDLASRLANQYQDDVLRKLMRHHYANSEYANYNAQDAIKNNDFETARACIKTLINRKEELGEAYKLSIQIGDNDLANNVLGALGLHKKTRNLVNKLYG